MKNFINIIEEASGNDLDAELHQILLEVAEREIDVSHAMADIKSLFAGTGRIPYNP